MKIIFLDIDGVINSGRTAVATGDVPHGITHDQKKYFDETALKLIQKICTFEDVKCVLSSSWRMDHSPKEMSNFLELPIMDSTPRGGSISLGGGLVLELASSRGVEIKSWLDANNHLSIEKYIIIDDHDDMLEEQKPYFVKTSHDDGFSLADYRKSCTLLGLKPR